MKELLGMMTDGILGKMGRGILDVVFPARCVGCGEEGHYICRRCEGFTSEVALICPLCQQSSLTGEHHENCVSRYGLEGLANIWEYEGVIKSLLHNIKYNGMTHAAVEIVQNAYVNMTEDTTRFKPFLSYLFSKETFITCVPMFKRKEKFRGFNQAAVFAREIAKIVGRSAISLLEKIVDTKPQVDLTKEERLHSVNDVFRIKSGSQVPKQVILVDDVWTTGATMKECSRVLRKAGAQEVWGFTLARTP
jgi:competence protein ComFC